MSRPGCGGRPGAGCRMMARLGPLIQTQYLNPAVLSEMMVEGEGSRDATGVHHGERDGVAQRPVLGSVSSQDVPGFLLFRWMNRHDRQPACEQPLTGNRSSELPHEQCVRFGFDVVRDKARALLGRDAASHGDCTRMVGVVCIEQSQNGARIPEDAAGHRSRTACLLRAPGVLPPPRPAPARRKIGWSCANAGMPAVRRRRVRVRIAVAGTRRRPPRRTLGSSPRCISRQTVERETPSARPASSTVIMSSATFGIVSHLSQRLNRLMFLVRMSVAGLASGMATPSIVTFAASLTASA